MLFSNLFLQAALLSVAAVQTAALAIGGKPNMMVKPYKHHVLQDIVTWDEHSLFVRGERVLFYSGEFHPFRLPVPSLWLDVFQKIKALGYNGVSVYFDWALLEGKPGHYMAEGIFALEPFFEAAETAGIYLLARPGPYINAEVSGGGYPGWMQRNSGILRTRESDYLEATRNYVSSISKTIAKAQITNGGPVILLQPENEYSQNDTNPYPFPDPVYFQYVEDQYRNNSIVVPFISNDARPQGYFAPTPSAPGAPTKVDIYGHDGYPLGFDCANPYTWPDGAMQTPLSYGNLHAAQSPSTPFSLVEFQGGAFDPWGGLGFDKCAALLGPEFERVFYKSDYSFGVTIFNVYMTYGGTNWGNLGHPGGYTSYDYGAVIREERTVDREKYSQAKLQAVFLQSSPAYLTAIPQNNSHANSSHTGNPAIATTVLLDDVTSFYVVRHAAYNSLETTKYDFTFPTSKGNITVSDLSLHGRDSKIYVSDYDVGGVELLYSTAEIFTWKKYGDKRVLVVYGGPGETNELAIVDTELGICIEGQDAVTETIEVDICRIRFTTCSQRQIVEVGDLTIYILDRNSAYNYWVIDTPSDPITKNYTNGELSMSTPIVKIGYLLRTVEVNGNTIYLTGDLNATSPIEVIGAPQPLHALVFNGESLDFKQTKDGVVTATAVYKKPSFTLPDLATIGWKVIDSLPEIQPDYDDSLWTKAELTHSNNTARNLTTPTSLYSSDYGYHTGYLVYRGRFTANGREDSLYLATQGGLAFGHSVWLNSEFVGSFYGADKYFTWNQTYTLPSTTAGQEYIITILIDNMGLDENFRAASTEMKFPRGVIDFALADHDKGDVTWKLTGNLHGEDYEDRTRGPLNEGGLYAERHGFHLPKAPISDWKDSRSGPMDGIAAAGVAFYATTFDLNLPVGYDIPLSFSFTNSSMNTTETTPAYRCQLWVNGYQFGKYVYNIGPQDVFPVPEGIWNYRGENFVAMSLWALEKEGAKVGKVELVAGWPVQSGFGAVEPAPQTGWRKRDGVY